jgi:hypothetical protein
LVVTSAICPSPVVFCLSLKKNTDNILTFNCKNIKTCGLLFKELEKDVDIYLIQEHWLFDCQLDLLNEIHNDYIGIGKAVDSKYLHCNY